MAQKYIEGDVVMYDNKVMVVKEPRDGSHFDLSCHKEGLVYCLVGVDEIKPVSLTPEILEKNGWKKEVRRKIFADGTYSYIDNNYLGTEMLMYNSIGRATPVLWLLPETILATDWEEV